MRPIWYGDRRDRVKWGALFYLANHYGLETILQVPYLQDEVIDTRLFIGSARLVSIPAHIWGHFSDLQNIRRLRRWTGINIVVIKDAFAHAKRGNYVDAVVKRIRRYGPKLVFLDPDTGIQPPGRSGPTHAAIVDIDRIWGSLRLGDILSVYQHAQRTSGWVQLKRGQLAEVCGARVNVIQAPAIAKDVVLLWCRR
jgi:hypothetical protein